MDKIRFAICRTFVAFGVLLAFRYPTAVAQDAARENKHEKPAKRVDTYGDWLPDGAVARVGTTRFWQGWTGPQPPTFTLDGKKLIARDAEDRIHVWDLVTTRDLGLGDGINDHYWGYALSPDGSTVVTAAKVWQIWDLATHKELRKINVVSNRPTMTFSPDGKRFAFADWTRDIQVWETDDWQAVTRLKPFGAVEWLTFLADNKTLVYRDSDPRGTVLVWFDVAAHQEIRRVKLAVDASITVSPDHSMLAGMTAPLRLEVWNAVTGESIVTIALEKEKMYGEPCWCFSPDGRVLAFGNPGGNKITFYAADKSGQLLQTWETRWGIRSLTYSPDGKTLALVADNTIEIREAETGRTLLHSPGRLEGVAGVRFDPTGRSIVVSCLDGQIASYDPVAGTKREALHEPSAGLIEGLPKEFMLSTASADGATGAFMRAGGDIYVTDLSAKKILSKVTDVVADTLDLSPDGKFLVLTNRGIASVRDAKSGKLIGQLPEVPYTPPPPEPPLPPGKFLPMGGGKIITLENAGYSIHPRAFSANSRLLAAVAPNMAARTLQVYDMTTGRELNRLTWKDDTCLGGVAFIGSQFIVAVHRTLVGLQERSVRVWELHSGQVVRQFAIKVENIESVAVTSDGRILAVGNQMAPDNSVILFEMASGAEVGRLSRHPQAIRQLCFSPDGRLIASGSLDNTVLVWDATGLAPDAKPISRDAPTAELEVLWSDLASPDAVKARRAMWQLSSIHQTVSFFQNRLKPAEKVEHRSVAQLIEDMSSDQFSVREKSMLELEERGPTAEAEMRKALGVVTDHEVQQRLDLLIKGLVSRPVDVEKMRLIRAVETLEHIGNVDARSLLTRLSTGAPESIVTKEAVSALERLEVTPVN